MLISSHRKLLSSKAMVVNPLAVPLAVQGGEQLAHFVLGQVLADSIGRVRLAPGCSDLPFRQGGAASEGLVRAARCAGPRAENVVKDVGLLEVVLLQNE